ncbi:MAG: NAD(P)-dependent oxidoreductase [Geminicoccaceae bacterium]
MSATTTPGGTAKSQNIAFIGLGHLGRHLAMSLIEAGFDLRAHDLDEAAAAPLIERGARFAPTLKSAAAGADVVFTCLPSPAATEAVLTSKDGILVNLGRGATWVEMSTNDPDAIRALAARAAEKGIRALEAPVTGGVHKAASGEITVLVGGDEALFNAHLPLFQAMGGEVIHMGDLGQASVIKVITNMLAFIHLLAAGEALTLAKCAGLDLKKSFQAIKASSGNSFVHETESQVILNGSYDIGFTMDLALKDLGITQKIASECGVPLDLAAQVEQAFRRAKGHYGGDAWSPKVVKLLEDAMGIELRADGFPPRL